MSDLSDRGGRPTQWKPDGMREIELGGLKITLHTPTAHPQPFLYPLRTTVTEASVTLKPLAYKPVARRLSTWSGIFPAPYSNAIAETQNPRNHWNPPLQRRCFYYFPRRTSRRDHSFLNRRKRPLQNPTNACVRQSNRTLCSSRNASCSVSVWRHVCRIFN